MRFSPLILLAQAAVMTTAFLIPPEFSEEQLKELMMPIDIGAGLALSKMSMSRIVRIPCEGCPVKEEGVSTDLILDFNLPSTTHHVMTLNGATILPLEETEVKPLIASQIPRGVDTILYFVDRSHFPVVTVDNARLINTDYIGADGSKQFTLELNILGVEGVPVSIEGVEMVINEDSNGDLSFGHVNPLKKGALKSCGMDVKCMFNKMLTRVKESKMVKWGGGCGGKAHGQLEEPKHKHHHNHEGNHHHKMGMFMRVVTQILAPVLVGIVMGMAASLVGLAVSHILFVLYAKVKGIKRCRKSGGRCGRRARRERERLAAEQADGEVEKGLLVEEPIIESPPAYKDAETPVEKE
ncbi:hypothetical protein BZA77DRAFT_386591 [Pyronema omphalodes]|nr:hypothetical protein BZA77DRAFT_386591 [Pyronema omphalodes]